jgi:arylsulfatase
MHTGKTLRIIFVLWTAVIAAASLGSAWTILDNDYLGRGLVRCAIAGHTENLHWASFLFALTCACVLLLAVVLRLLFRDPACAARASVRTVLFVYAVYLVIVYVNTKSWYPEFYTTEGMICNGLVLVALLAGAVFLPLPLDRLRARLSRLSLRMPAALGLLLYGIPFLADMVPVKENMSNVLFITVDTLRADRLGMSGYSRQTSRNIDAFSGECIVFRNAYSQSSFTPPSHASMFTSRFVSNHGLYAWEELGDEEITLAEVLSNEGYETAAFVNMSLLSEQNLGQGFRTKVESFLNLENCLSEKLAYTMKKKAVDFYDGHEINRMFLEWLDGRGKRPFFAWLHYWDVHRPYARDPRYEAMYSDGSDVERKVGRELWHYNLNSGRLEGLGFGNTELSFISDRYDAGIYMFDQMFEELLAGLKERGMYDNTLLVLTSDHGESLLEREEMFFAHDPFLYNEVIKVPLMIAVPGQHAARNVEESVMLVDIYPSILRFLGIEEEYSVQADPERVLRLEVQEGDHSGQYEIHL